MVLIDWAIMFKDGPLLERPSTSIRHKLYHLILAGAIYSL